MRREKNEEGGGNNDGRKAEGGIDSACFVSLSIT